VTRPGARWWAGRIRQFRAYVGAGVPAGERAGLEAWVPPAVLAVFDAMHVADRRHGLDVVATLRREGVRDPEVLLAGLIHDAGKGTTGLVPRVLHALAHGYGPSIRRVATVVPGYRAALDGLERHPERSAEMAAAAGCSARTVELIRWQEAPRDPEFGELLRLADERN